MLSAPTILRDAVHHAATRAEESKPADPSYEPRRSGETKLVERPLPCEEAAKFLRVHPKTVKRMARNGEVPGHFRFGRWYFYLSELDSWMKMELNFGRHP